VDEGTAFGGHRGRRPRRDATRNREAIIAAAERVFAERGIDAPLDEAAREAGVGPATLYRHFPSRLALLEGIYREAVQRYLDAAERALAVVDPWEALAGFVEDSVRITHALPSPLLLASRLAADGADLAISDALSEPIRLLVARAHAAGVLHPAVASTDLVLIPHLLRDLGEAEAWRRPLALLLRGLRADDAAPLPADGASLSVAAYTRLVHGGTRR